MKAALVYNPVKVDLRALRKAVAALVPDDWPEPEWFETGKDDAGRQAAKDALAAGAELVVACGGDGTVRVVSEVVCGNDARLGIVPAGTGNLLARNLGIDVVFLRAAVRTALLGRERTIDMGWAEIETPAGERSKHGFVVMAGFGLDAQMIAETDEQLKKKVGWVAYIGAFARAFKKIERVRLRYQIDDNRKETVRVNTVLVGNCGVLQGNVVLLPDAKVDDGKLDVALIRPKDAYGWAQLMWNIVVNSGPIHRALRRRRIIGAQKSLPTLGYGQISSMDMRLDEARVMQLDGDPVGEIIAMRCTVEHAALTVHTPEPGLLPRL